MLLKFKFFVIINMIVLVCLEYSRRIVTPSEWPPEIIMAAKNSFPKPLSMHSKARVFRISLDFKRSLIYLWKSKRGLFSFLGIHAFNAPHFKLFLEVPPLCPMGTETLECCMRVI